MHPGPKIIELGLVNLVKMIVLIYKLQKEQKVVAKTILSKTYYYLTENFQFATAGVK